MEKDTTEMTPEEMAKARDAWLEEQEKIEHPPISFLSSSRDKNGHSLQRINHIFNYLKNIGQYQDWTDEQLMSFVRDTYWKNINGYKILTQMIGETPETLDARLGIKKPGSDGPQEIDVGGNYEQVMNEERKAAVEERRRERDEYREKLRANGEDEEEDEEEELTAEIAGIETLDEAYLLNHPPFYPTTQDGRREGKSIYHEILGKHLMVKHHIVQARNKYFLYDGKVYVADTEDFKMIQRLMIDEIENITISQRREVLDYIKIEAPEVRMSFVNAKYIAFENCVLNVYTMETMDHSPDLFITNLIPHEYDPNAYSEKMDTTLDKLASYDKATRQQIEEAFGYIMYRRSELRTSFWFISKRHRGKSTIGGILTALVGEANKSSLSAEDFENNFAPQLVDMKLVNVADDINSVYIKKTGFLKALISGGMLILQQKHKTAYQEAPFCKLVFLCNELPRFHQGDEALIERMNIIKLEYDFTKDPEHDHRILDELMKEKPIQYAINLGIAALREILVSEQFTVSDRSRETKKEYIKEVDGFLDYISLHKKEDFLEQITTNVYREYVDFCKLSGRERGTLGEKAFSRRLDDFFGMTTRATYIYPLIQRPDGTVEKDKRPARKFVDKR